VQFIENACDGFGVYIYLIQEMRLKLSMENEKKVLELIVRGENELFVCRQEQARERVEREQERQVARKQAVDFVESEILALNELCLDLGEKYAFLAS
jgi:hypothetical protein